MKYINPGGTEADCDIPLVSLTREPETGQKYEDEGWVRFKEIIVCHDGLHIATIQCFSLLIEFQGKLLVNVKPKLRASYSDTNYGRVRSWISQAQHQMAHRVLKQMPHVVPFNSLTQQPESSVDFETEMAGFQLFNDMRKAQGIVS